MEDWISKRELLAQTGVSYGQLYRWKRENLIPDSWFVKRSAFTGQETFLPRERVLERIRFILANKDRYTLQQLLDQLTPVARSRTYPAELLARIDGAQRPVASLRRLTGEDAFNHGQALCAMIGADMIASNAELPDESMDMILKALIGWQSADRLLERDDGRIAVLRVGSAYLPLCLRPDSRITAPEGVDVTYELSLSDIPTRCTKTLNQVLEGDG